MNSSTTIKRVQKLLRLSKSPNEHEAARAHEQAKALMERHGLTDDDVAETVVEVADSQADEYRLFLATLTSTLHGCAVVVNKRNDIAFRGRAPTVRRALAFYQSAIDAFSSSRLPPIAPWLMASAEEVWRFCWWDGFAAAVYERFPIVRQTVRTDGAQKSKPDHVEPTATDDWPEPVSMSQQKVKNVVEDVRIKVYELSANINVDWLKSEGRRAGRAAGEHVSIREDLLALR